MSPEGSPENARARPAPGFIGRQVDALRRFGVRVIVDKVRRHAVPLVLHVFAFLPAIVCVVAMRAARPVRLLRTGRLFAWRIGHYVGNTEVYLCERDDGMQPDSIDLFSHWGLVSNRQIKRMWDRVLHTSWFYGEMHWVNRMLPGWERHVVDIDRGEATFDWTGVTVRHGPHLSFTAKECEEGRRRLAEITGGSGLPFICVHSRDAGYLRVRTPYADTSYNDYRDSDVATFIDAMRRLSGRGYTVLRMGSVVDAPLAAVDDPRIVDYATTARSDFMDVFLEANCRFHLGDAAGLNDVPRAFRRPVVSVNYVPILHDGLHALAPGAIFIPKRLYSKRHGRCLTFREFSRMDVEPAAWGLSETYAIQGITLLDSTAGEIAAVVCEMDDRIAGMWVETDEDRDLQASFWSAIEDDAHEVLGARIGAAFLRENRDLLG